jgi:hypothetical protein
MTDLFRELSSGSKREEYQDYVKRYETGPPWDGISEEEVLNRYGQVSSQVPDDVYQEAAQEAFSRLSPQERQDLVRQVQQGARSQNLDMRDLDLDGQPDAYEDPGRLAQAATRMKQKNPDLLGQLLGSGGGRQPDGQSYR